MNLRDQIKKVSKEAFQQAFSSHLKDIDNPNEALDTLIEVTQATNDQFGHYQCNSAMKLAKKLSMSPRSIAENWVDTLLKNPLCDPMQSSSMFNSIEIAGPGFINFTLSAHFLNKNINEQLHDSNLGAPVAKKPMKIIIDYSSPNVAKEMHVGHLRTTIIGDALARLFRFLGHQVLPLNHIGDWGTQFGMLIAYLKELMPNIVEETETPANIHLQDLVQWYRAAKKRFDEDAEFKKKAQLEVVSLQSGNQVSKKIWNHICEISRHSYQAIYDLLDIRLVERGESFYNPLLPKTMHDLEFKNLLQTSDGAQCMFLDGFVNRNNEPLPLILQKADGAYNYATTDLTSIRHRIEEEKGDWLIYVIDAGQSLHLKMVFAAAEKAGYLDRKKTRVDHADFGLVLRSDGKKFKTREGETERLIDLLTLAIDKAKMALAERNPEMSKEEVEESAKIFGIDAIKYADLSCHRTSDYMFSYERMLSFEGNTAAFLLYAYVRILGIQRKTQVNTKDLMEAKHSIDLREPSEIKLGLMALQYPEVLSQMAEELLPNRLTDYLFHLAEQFHIFFHQCRVEGSKEQESRLLLCELVARVLSSGLAILGLKTLKRM